MRVSENDAYNSRLLFIVIVICLDFSLVISVALV